MLWPPKTGSWDTSVKRQQERANDHDSGFEQITQQLLAVPLRLDKGYNHDYEGTK
jgi:hypothetical protein